MVLERLSRHVTCPNTRQCQPSKSQPHAVFSTAEDDLSHIALSEGLVHETINDPVDAVIEEAASNCPDAHLGGDGSVDIQYVGHGQGQVEDDAGDEHGQQGANQGDVRGREAVTRRVHPFPLQSRSRLGCVRWRDMEIFGEANLATRFSGAVEVWGL